MRILVVDDDPLTLEVLSARLEGWGHQVVTSQDSEAAWARLEGGASPHMAILDWMLPVMSGLDLCRKVRERSGPYMYILLLTGRTGREDVLEGFEAGADDYLTKPIDWGELEARLRAGERIVNLQNELIDAREALRTQAMQDPMTKVLNHGAIMEALDREVDRAHRENHPLALILCDLDRFKRVNDRYGHVVGDKVLREVTRRLRNCLRSYDALGRYGGEEFLMVLPNIDHDNAAKLAERIRVAVSTEPFRVDSLEIQVSLSQGLITWTVPTGIPAERLIQAADRALYAAKDAGRNRVRCVRFDPGDSDSVEECPAPSSGSDQDRSG